MGPPPVCWHTGVVPWVGSAAPGMVNAACEVAPKFVPVMVVPTIDAEVTLALLRSVFVRMALLRFAPDRLACDRSVLLRSAPWKSQPLATELGPRVATSQSLITFRENCVRVVDPETLALLTATRLDMVFASAGESQWCAALTTTFLAFVNAPR